MYKPFRDTDYTPWSFVWPVAIGVMLGVLLADLVRLVVGGLLAGALLSAWSDDVNEKLGTTPGHLPARPGVVVAEPTRPTRPTANQVPIYDGPSTAIRKGDIRACVGGYGAYREESGWTQHTNGGLRPCSANSP